MVSTVTVRGQTAIPANIRKRYNIKPQSKLEWIDDGHTIMVVPVSNDPIKALRGRFKGIDVVNDLLKERRRDKKKEDRA